MNRKDYKRRIGSGFQQVSQRLLMAGDVDVGFSNSDLYLSGDGASYRIQVTTVNGGSFGDVMIVGGGGNDRATLQNAEVTDDLYAHMGNGNDQLYLFGNSVADNKYLHGGWGSETLSAGGNNFNAYSYDYGF